MRVFVVAASVVGMLGIVGCPHAPPAGGAACSAPVGCVSAATTNGTCACTAWETVSTETVALPFVVANVTYPPIGTASLFRYGDTSDPSMLPQPASSLGVTYRAVIRRPDGSEQIARIGTVEQGFSAGFALTDAWMRLDAGGAWTMITDVDVPAPGADGIAVWVNPAATVVTDFAGQKTVNWSSRPVCFWPGLDCRRAEIIGFSTAALRGETSWGPAHDAYLDAIGPEGRAALLAFDPRDADGSMRFPRYQRLADVSVGATPRTLDATWQPCTDTARFEVLAETVVPLEGGDAFVLQYGVRPDAACSPERPALVVGTATPGCSIDATVFVDRLSGSLAMQPSAATGACTSD